MVVALAWRIGRRRIFSLSEILGPATIGNVLLLRIRTSVVRGEVVKLFSFDGRTWFSKARDQRAFKKRRVREKVACQKVFAAIAELNRRILDPTTDYKP
jgi:hypothetical protein